MIRCFAFIALLYLPVSAQATDEIVARVGDVSFSAEEFRRYLVFNVPNTGLFKTHEQRLVLLSRMIADELMYQDALRQGWENDPDLNRELKALEKKAVQRDAYEREVLRRAIPDEIIRTYYEKMGKQVKLRHILLKADNGDAEQKVKKRLQQLRQDIVNGDDFGETARRVSQDSLTVQNGGDLGFVKWGHRAFGNDFYEMVFNSKIGEVSQPARSKKGYHLFVVEDRRTVWKPSFEDLKEELRRDFVGQKHLEVQRYEREFYDKVLKHQNIVVDDSLLMKLYSKIVEVTFLRHVKPSQTLEPNLRSHLSDKLLSGTVISFPDSTLTVDRFLSVNGKQLAFGEALFNSYHDFYLYVADMLPLPDLIAEWAYDHDYQNHQNVRKHISEMRRTLMIVEIERVMVSDKFTPPPEDEYRAYYEVYRERYRYPEQREVQEIFVTDLALARDITRRARAGEDFNRLANKYNQRRLTQANGGYLGYLAPHQQGVLGKHAATMSVGDISDPIESKLGYSVIRILDRKPATVKPFERAVVDVKRDMRNYLLAELREAWLSSLRQETKIEIFEDNLKAAFKD